ncbi:MAG TPA: tyrosine-protein phosphatase [Amycolatopsis sp.]|nr:tyrosine-protein phosphatase [Amycolatopsis sp.]
MTDVIKLGSVPNFRDLAGPVGYSTPHGPMRRGQLFRSSAFCASPSDLEALAPVGIVAIHDLRGQGEIDMRPDAVLAGATWRHAWIPGLSGETIRALRTAADVRAAMIQHYREFVTAPHKRAGVARVLAAVSEGSAPQVFHCAEGKDRTGWVAMLLHRLAGVSEDDLVSDYLLTNELMRGNGDTRAVARAVLGDKPDEFFVPAMIADVAYLDAGLAQLEADYGDVEKYLSVGLGLSDDQLTRLRGLLLG